MRVLSIDPAASTGFSLFEDGRLIEYGFYKPSGELNKRLHSIYDFFRLKLKKNIDVLIVEDFKVGKFASAAESGYAIRAMFRLMAEQEKVDHHVINVTDWHKFLLGTTQATKKDKASLGKDALKILTKQKVLEYYNVEEKCINEWSGRITTTPFDVYDSVGIGHYFLEKNK